MNLDELKDSEHCYYHTDNGVLLKGDCMELMREFPNGCVDLVLTDIPYGVVSRETNGLRKFDKGLADAPTFDLNEFLERVSMIVRGSIYIWCGTEQLSDIRRFLSNNNFSTRVGVWEKTNPSPINGQHIWLSGIELCVYGKKPKAVFNEHCKNTVWRFPNGRSKLHPTEKNLKLFEYLISVSSNENNVVLDPCIGSGTTAVACENLNRKWIGIEIEDKYCEIVKRRLIEHGGGV